MVELLFVVCLHAAPDSCLQQSLFFNDITPERCAQGAQPELARWVEAHPDYRITRWRCQGVAPSSSRA